MLREGGNAEYAPIPCKVEAQDDDERSKRSLLFANSTAREQNDFEKTYQATRIKELLQSLKAKGHKLLDLGREAIRDFCKAADHEHQVRVAERVEAYTNVAVAFDIHG